MVHLESFFAKFANFSGRASRMEFIVIGNLALASIVLGGWLDQRLGTGALVAGRGGLYQLLSLLIAVLPLTSVCVRRLHDTGKSGLWLLLPYPIYLASLFARPGGRLGIVLLIFVALAGAYVIAMLLRAGDNGVNEYGDMQSSSVRVAGRETLR